MNVIEEVRRNRKDLARVLKRHSGIRRIIEDLYPDSAHFIYELLQNAEDKGAEEAQFTLTKTGVVFEHNGRPFNRRDIEKITDIGERASEDEDKIGRFGVGFKAVFAYSETPYIWSPTFSFKITDLVLPSVLDPKPDLRNWTRFEFPFNNPKKRGDDAYAEVKAGLNMLAETTLLFLRSLELIRWRVGNTSGEVRRIQHPENHVEVMKQEGGGITLSSHFLKFDEPVVGLETQRVAVAFVLDRLPNVKRFDPSKPLSKQMKIVPAMQGQVAVYFPAEKEASGLRFHLHAPFVPELSRASIKETPANQPLFDQLASFTATSLHKIRDLGLLTTDFLSALPNQQDQIPGRYEGIMAAIVDEMNNEPLTPTYAKGHAPAKQLLQARAALKDILSEEDIAFLVEHDTEQLQWAVGVTQKNTNIDRFLSTLAITEWDIPNFIEEVCERASEETRFISSPPYYVQGPDSEFIQWLSARTAEWHQKLYSLLYAELAPNGGCRRLKNLRIVRLRNGQYTIGSECFFPSEVGEDNDVLPRVERAVYTSGKSRSQQQNARKLLDEIGVREVGEAEQVEAILKQRYTEEAEIPDDKTYRNDLKRFVTLVEQESDKARLFAAYWIFKRKDGQWGQPNQVFLDEPFTDTGLAAYYDVFGEKADRVALSEFYEDCGIAVKRLVKFFEAVGVQTRLQIKAASCYSNPQWTYLSSVGGDRSTSPINNDYVIEGLKELLAKPSIAISKLIWRTMNCLPKHPNYLQATYQRNQTWGAHFADSQLVHGLRKAAWVPNGNGQFVRPKDATRDLLPDGFAFDPGAAWLKAIGFGQEATKRSEEQRQKEVVAKQLGFADNATLERARVFAALPPEEQERILAATERKRATELPENEPSNPKRRAERVAEKAAQAPERLSEERTRSVSLGVDRIKEEAAQYLSQLYTNADGDMICQICKGPLPFKLDDGSEYFEKVEFLAQLKKRHYQNYLALCPNHAAMFEYVNGSTDQLRDMFMKLSENELEIVLAQKQVTIYFTKTHIADLKEVINVDAGLQDRVLAEIAGDR